MSKEQNLNDVFARAVRAQGIDVVSMRNKVNRLEELFMRLVEGRDAGRAGQAGGGAHERADGSHHGARGNAEHGGPALGRLHTIVIREFSRIIRIWGQTIVPPAITATLYFVIFGSLIGRRIGDMGGFSYMQYIAPGLIMMAVITNSYGNVVSSFFGAKFGKHIEELLVSPLPNWLIVLGYVAGGLVRGLLVGVVVTLVALFFTHLHVEHPCSSSGRGAAHGARVLARRLHQRDVREELRPDQLDPDLRPDAADLLRRRVLLDHAAAANGRSTLSHANPILLHGQRVPLRLPRHQRRERRPRLRDHDRRGRGAAVRDRASG